MSIAMQVDYSKIPYSRPIYKMARLIQQTGGQTVTISTAGGQESVFEIAANNAYNFARSSLNFTMTAAASGAGNFNYYYQDTAAPIRQAQLYTRGGIYICDINDVNNYLKIALKPETKFSDFKTYPRFANAAVDAGPGRFLCPNFSLQSSSTKTLLLPFAIRHDNSNSDVPYDEPKYLEPGGDNTATPVFNIQLLLGLIKNTVLSIDKDIFLNEVLLLKIIWAPSTKIYFFGTSTTNPVTAAAAAAGGVAISNLILYMAQEVNQDIVASLRNQVMSSGMSLLIPYVYTFKNNPGAATSHSISVRLSRANGMRLQKIYLSAFHATESANTAYDCGNTTYNTNADTSKVGSFYTQLDNVRLQDINMNTGTWDDYMMLKDKLDGSVLQSRNMFYYNWFWLEDFTGAENKKLYEYDNLDTGLDLNQERKWDFYALAVRDNATATAYNYYAFCVCQKLLTIGPMGITVS